PFPYTTLFRSVCHSGLPAGSDHRRLPARRLQSPGHRIIASALKGMKIPTCTLPDVSPSVQVKNDEDILPLHLKAQTKSYKMSSLGYAFLTWQPGLLVLVLKWSGKRRSAPCFFELRHHVWRYLGVCTRRMDNPRSIGIGRKAFV